MKSLLDVRGAAVESHKFLAKILHKIYVIIANKLRKIHFIVSFSTDKKVSTLDETLDGHLRTSMNGETLANCIYHTSIMKDQYFKMYLAAAWYGLKGVPSPWSEWSKQETLQSNKNFCSFFASLFFFLWLRATNIWITKESIWTQQPFHWPDPLAYTHK